MIMRTALGLTSILFVTNTFASSNSGPMCEPVVCFSQATVAVNSQLIKDAPQFAWLTKNKSESKGWAFGSKGRGNSSNSGGSDGSWFTSMSVPSKGPVNSRGTFVFYPGKSTFAAYDSSGNLVTSGRASGGMNYCADVGRSCHTPVGNFRVHAKGDASCISKKYPIETGGGAPMPYCMYFNGGYAIHGSDYVPNRPASHGCIRLNPSTAQWMHQNFMQVGTVVKVHSY